MLANKTIAFLGGGNMAEALIRGLLANPDLQPRQLRVGEPRQERREELESSYGIGTSADNLALAQWADVVVLAVKPQVLPLVLSQLSPASDGQRLFVSIAAGVTNQSIEGALGNAPRVIRCMPNTPALVLTAASVLAAGNHATDQDVEICKAILDAVGLTEIVSEDKIDAVTGLSGGGPAYAFVFLEAMADAGVKLGLPRRVALRLAAQTLMGSAKLLLDTDGHPAQLKDMVTSPGGTTIAGLHALERGGLRTTVMSAVEAATLRARELGQD